MTQKKQTLCGLQVLFLLFNCQTPVLRGRNLKQPQARPAAVLMKAEKFTAVSAISSLTDPFSQSMIPSLTVDGRKNRCIPCIYWVAAIFAVVTDYSNLFFSFTFFLDCSHLAFGYELIVCPESADLV